MRDAVVDTITRLFVATDNRDWNGVKRVFADKVEFDMTSLAGGTPATMTPQQIADGWEQGLKPIQSVHHQAGNFLIAFSGSEADASCYGIAYHYRPTRSGRNTRVFVGTYDFHLRLHGDDWKIETFRFNLRFIDGNPNLESD